MGRAIAMENDINTLKMRLEKLENIVRGMTSTLSNLDEKSTKVKHLDLTKDKDEEKETNIKTDGKSSKPFNRSKSKSKSKTK